MNNGQIRQEFLDAHNESLKEWEEVYRTLAEFGRQSTRLSAEDSEKLSQIYLAKSKPGIPEF